MKVLVIGSGGREHALAWKLSQGDRVQIVYVAPGNGGTATEPGLKNLPLTDPVALADFCQAEKIALTVVGPEAPLAAGVVDAFRKQGLRVFGPTKAAAQLESSKAFSKAFMKRHNIPTAEYDTFTDPVLAHAYIDQKGAPIVVKADGLAAGKGVVVALTMSEAHEAVDFMLLDNTLGVSHNAGLDGQAVPRVVIEEFLQGEEASFIVMVDGKNVLPLATSQDHKRLLAGDLGPNTGGMGAYSPAPVVTPDVHARAMREIILPTIRGMEKDGIPYTGFLYAGLMIDASGHPKTLEFNCRMGDPETEVVLPRIQTDLVELLVAAADGELNKVNLQVSPQTAVTTVLVSGGYPDVYEKGKVISAFSDQVEEVTVFHAGTATLNGQVVTNGGRVLAITALANSLENAVRRSQEAARTVQFSGKQYRKDIGLDLIRYAD